MTGKEYKERINALIPDDVQIIATTDHGVFEGWCYIPHKDEDFFKYFKPVPAGTEVNVGYGTTDADEGEFFNVPIR